MSDEFGAPSSTSGIQWEDYKGALLLIEPKGFEPEIETQFGTTSAVRANLTVLDGDSAEEVFRDTLIFPKVVQNQVKNADTRYVLGRLGQGEKKKGQSAPWKLAEATDADKQIARDYLRKAAPAPF